VGKITEFLFKENPTDAQFIFSIFRPTPLHVSGVSKAHHQEVHRMDRTIGTYEQKDVCLSVCCPGWV